MDINISINNKRPTVDGAPVIVCGNDGYKINFTFDEEWQDLDPKTARFVFTKNGEVKSIDKTFSGNLVEVPKLKGTREVLVGVFSGDVRTSTSAKIPCEPSIRCLSATTEDLTPSQYEQIMAILYEMEGGGGGSSAVGIKAIGYEATTTDGAANRLVIELTDGSKKTYPIYNGKTGSPGVGILKIIQSKVGTGSHAENIIDIVLTDGRSYPITIRNGGSGSSGSDASVTKENIQNALGYTPANQNDVDGLSQEIVDLGGISEAVKEGVSTLVNKALSRCNGNVFRFLVSSDAHQKNGHELITKGTKELGQAIGEVLRLIDVDFFGELGDVAWGSSASNNATTVLEESKMFNKFVMANVITLLKIRAEGNHETDMLTDAQIRALIYCYNKGLVQDAKHWLEGYGYMDFIQGVRVICLNTNQHTGNDASGVSDEQLKWFAETALNVPDNIKYVITMGHHPLSFNNATLIKNCVYTVEAFINSANFSFTTNDGTTITADYTNKSCQYVGHFHGHAHAYSVVKMQKYVSSGNYEEIDAWEICIPNACYERNNQYLNNGQYTARYSTEITYSKSDEDGLRTSFNLITVDLDNGIIYADNYGAGIDRIVSYDAEEIVTYTITRNLTNCTTSSSIASVVENASHTETLTASDGYVLDSVKVTMGGIDITSSAYSDGTISISEVTGNVVVTASAVEEPEADLLNLTGRTYSPTASGGDVAATDVHEIDYTKIYSMKSDGTRTAYAAGKITAFDVLSDNSFTFTVSSTTGYGVELPIAVEYGKEYVLTMTSSVISSVFLVKYNPDGTFNFVAQISGSGLVSGETVTITPEDGYLYSLFFTNKHTANAVTTFTGLSLKEA